MDTRAPEKEGEIYVYIWRGGERKRKYIFPRDSKLIWFFALKLLFTTWQPPNGLDYNYH